MRIFSFPVQDYKTLVQRKGVCTMWGKASTHPLQVWTIPKKTAPGWKGEGEVLETVKAQELTHTKKTTLALYKVESKLIPGRKMVWSWFLYTNANHRTSWWVEKGSPLVMSQLEVMRWMVLGKWGDQERERVNPLTVLLGEAELSPLHCRGSSHILIDFKFCKRTL